MPKLNQYRVVKAQVESFKELGCLTVFDVQDHTQRYAPKIRIFTDTKFYRFSEPDWDIVSLQLAKLYGVLKNEKRMHIRSNRHATNGTQSL